MYSKAKAIPVKDITGVMRNYSSLFRDLRIPAVYEGDAAAIGMTELPLRIPSEQVSIEYVDGYIDGRNTLGLCAMFPTADYMMDNVLLNYPKFELTFAVKDGCINEDVILHEMIHMYQDIYEYNSFFFADSYRHRNKELEKKFHKKYVAPARAKLLRRLNYRIRKAYGEDMKHLMDACYQVLMYGGSDRVVAGSHDLVFYRISLLLDKTMGYRPGTTFGYTLDDFIEDVYTDVKASGKIA